MPVRRFQPDQAVHGQKSGVISPNPPVRVSARSGVAAKSVTGIQSRVPHLFCNTYRYCYSLVLIRKTMNSAQMIMIPPNPGDWTVPVASGAPAPAASGLR